MLQLVRYKLRTGATRTCCAAVRLSERPGIKNETINIIIPNYTVLSKPVLMTEQSLDDIEFYIAHRVSVCALINNNLTMLSEPMLGNIVIK